MQDFSIIKYPRTPHLEGSRLQLGDEDLSQVRFAAIKGRHLVLEEKVDGANSAISFDNEGNLLLQSRGHYLTGGARERHYDLMKQWANVHRDLFWNVLSSRYIMYGEWMYAKHSIYYDALPHYFLELDILDRETGLYLHVGFSQAKCPFVQFLCWPRDDTRQLATFCVTWDLHVTLLMRILTIWLI